MKKLFLVFICLHSIAFLFGQKTDNKLQNKLEETIKGFNGDIGIYVKNIHTGQIVSINADTIFPTASIVKVPILLGIMIPLSVLIIFCKNAKDIRVVWRISQQHFAATCIYAAVFAKYFNVGWYLRNGFI